MIKRILKLPVDDIRLEGELTLPAKADTLIIFSHGSGNWRMSNRNKKIAAYLQKAGFGTLLLDLLSGNEDEEEYRFDIDLLSYRLLSITKWIHNNKNYQSLDLAYFGNSLGTAAALKTAAKLGPMIKSVVSRGGRPDLIKEDLPAVPCPTLFIVGEYDSQIVKLNELALRYINTPRQLVIVPAASHFFDEPGKLDMLARIAVAWLRKYASGNEKKRPQLNH